MYRLPAFNCIPDHKRQQQHSNLEEADELDFDLDLSLEIGDSLFDLSNLVSKEPSMESKIIAQRRNHTHVSSKALPTQKTSVYEARIFPSRHQVDLLRELDTSMIVAKTKLFRKVEQVTYVSGSYGRQQSGGLSSSSHHSICLTMNDSSKSHNSRRSLIKSSHRGYNMEVQRNDAGRRIEGDGPNPAAFANSPVEGDYNGLAFPPSRIWKLRLHLESSLHCEVRTRLGGQSKQAMQRKPLAFAVRLSSGA